MAIFTEIFQNIDTAVVQTIASGTAQLVNVLSPLFFAGFTLYMLFLLFSYWQGTSPEVAMVDLLKRIAAWTVILTLSLNISGYNEYVLPLVLHLGDGLSQAFSGQPASNASVLDALTEQLIKVINSNAKLAAETTGLSGIGERIETALINLLLLICFSVFLVIAAAYIMLAKVFLAILAVVGPVFIACALFPMTRNLASAWAMQVLNYALLLLLMAITAGVFINYLNNSLSSVSLVEAVTHTATVHAALATMMFAIILLKLPELASGLAGGIAANGFGAAVGAFNSGRQLLSKKPKPPPPPKPKPGGGGIKQEGKGK